MSTLAITQVKSSNGANGRQRDTLRSLGLRRIGHTVERPDSEPLRGLSVDAVLGLGGRDEPQNGTVEAAEAEEAVTA